MKEIDIIRQFIVSSFNYFKRKYRGKYLVREFEDFLMNTFNTLCEKKLCEKCRANCLTSEHFYGISTIVPIIFRNRVLYVYFDRKSIVVDNDP